MLPSSAATWMTWVAALAACGGGDGGGGGGTGRTRDAGGVVDGAPADAGPQEDTGASVGDAGDGEDGAAPGDDGGPACTARDCATAGIACGPLDDGCGATLDCGTCDADMTCSAAGRCVSACVPEARATSDGGGRCGDLAQAWTARGINVGYHAFRVRAPIEMYSGDYSGTPGAIFEPGAATGGVVLQVIPAGSFVGLSSTGPWYSPATSCLDGASCGAPGRDACTDDAPPRRPGLGGFVWGYAYSGASHMQGWIPEDYERLVFAGFDPGHPCARGPAGVDYEASRACGRATSCAGGNATCGAVNPCDEGGDDCGRTECGAMTGGVLTPTAHRKTVRRPATAHVCTRTPPHPSVACLENGSERDFFFVYPFGAYLYWAQNSTTKHWLHHGDRVQSWYHTRDAQGVLWDFVEVLDSRAPVLTPASDGSGTDSGEPCRTGGTCGWVQAVFLDP